MFPNDPNNNYDRSQGFQPQMNAAPQRPVYPPVPPRPPRFWQIVLKDLSISIVCVVLFCVLAFSLVIGSLAGLAGALGSVAPESGSITETTIAGNEKCEGKVVVLPIEGVIETNETGFIPEAIQAIREDGRVRALVLRVNSPGGTISGSDYYLHLLKQLKEDLELPIIVSMGDMATSGGYYISTVADKIYAERSTTTGSIGVIVSMYNAAELCKNLGVRSNSITSGAMKGMGDFMKEPTPEETAIWQKMVDDGYEQFLSVVKEGRAYYRGEAETPIVAKPKREHVAGVNVKVVKEEEEETNEVAEAEAEAELAQDETQAETEAADDASGKEETAVVEPQVEADEDVVELADDRDAELRKLADGRIYSAADAKDLHLIDEIGFVDDAIKAAIEAAGLPEDDVEVVRYEEEVGLFDSLVGIVAKPEPLGRALKTITTPKAYYMCPRVLP